MYSVYSVVRIRDARAAMRRGFQHRDPEAQRHGGHQMEEVTTEYTEYTERGAAVLCLCVFVSLC